MAQEVTLGGDRLGSGNQMKQELHNYGMNSFNQNRDWKSTMAPGILYPCFKEIGTNFGTFDIDIDTFVRTLPTKGPLFGSFKMQVDLFNVPFRLYQGILHNNPVDIGLNMNKVYLPMLEVTTVCGQTAPKAYGSNWDDQQVSTSALIKYLGISGIGMTVNYNSQNRGITRKFQCVPILGYYDIFKNYYANKQEEKAYVITPGEPTTVQAFNKIIQGASPTQPETIYDNNSYNNEEFEMEKGTGSCVFTLYLNKKDEINDPNDYKDLIYINANTESEHISTLENNGLYILDLYDGEEYGLGKVIVLSFTINNWQNWVDWAYQEVGSTETKVTIQFEQDYNTNYYQSDIKLEPFALKNIDKMRSKLLANNELEDNVTIWEDSDEVDKWGINSGEDQTGLPYVALAKTTEEGLTWNAFTQNGLVVKTYQSDLFNNWLDNSLVDQISNRTKIDTTNGGFTPDTLILQEKIYKLLNRILVSGGTYYDWQEATYGEGVARMCEIPMYIGGMSTEIMFEEVIANSAAETDGRYQALGALGGKGRDVGKKGGNNIHVRMDEPGYIIGIVSITPRISVSQGNDWDMTDIRTMDDLHKPELDGIGFQDLMAEQMAWWTTTFGFTPGFGRQAVGKQTAWINYQTAIDKVYGDFAKGDGYSFMVLNRNYELDPENWNKIKDLTTYIDPAKYNYAFAYQDLAAQNFWVQLSFKCTSRRKMGAQQLPTL